MNIDATPTNLTEDEWKAHPVYKEFTEDIEAMGVDLTKWEFCDCEHDEEPYEYWANTPPWRHGHVYYSNPKLENHTLGCDFNDSEGKWRTDQIEITQD